MIASSKSKKETIILNQDQDMNVNEPSHEKGEVLVRITSDEDSDVPLFLRDISDGKKGDAQDEKDKTGE
jgi:hypothetical protein